MSRRQKPWIGKISATPSSLHSPHLLTWQNLGSVRCGKCQGKRVAETHEMQAEKEVLRPAQGGVHCWARWCVCSGLEKALGFPSTSFGNLFLAKHVASPIGRDINGAAPQRNSGMFVRPSYWAFWESPCHLLHGSSNFIWLGILSKFCSWWGQHVCLKSIVHYSVLQTGGIMGPKKHCTALHKSRETITHSKNPVKNPLMLWGLQDDGGFLHNMCVV